MNLNKTVLGIELGSTRIKAVLIDEKHLPIASGDFEWENQLVDGIWTYSMEAVHTGLQACFIFWKINTSHVFRHDPAQRSEPFLPGSVQTRRDQGSHGCDPDWRIRESQRRRAADPIAG